MKKRILLATAGMVLLATWARAQDSTTSAGLLLKNHISVRAEGMAGAQAAVAVDAAGAHDFNPASLLGAEYPRVSAAYYSGLVDDAFGSLAYDMPWQHDWAFGASFTYYDAGVMELVTLDGDVSNVRAQKDMLLSGTAARRFYFLGQEISAGANVKILHSTLVEEYSAIALAVDAGARYEFKDLVENLHIGLVIKNVGTPLKYLETADALPAYALAGLAYSFSPDENVGILLAGDANYDLEKKIYGHVGAQVTLFDLVDIRGGYKSGYDLGAIAVGLGVHWKNFSLDYAFNLMEVLNSVHRLSLGYTLAPLEFKKKGVKAEEPVATQEEMIEDLVEDMTVTAKPEGATERLQAQVLEIRRVGGMVSEVVMNLGRNHGIREGFQGSLVDANGAPIAGIVIHTVDAELSLAEVKGLSKDIEGNVWAIIERPVRE